MELNYHILDVFTDKNYSGNPLSVVIVDEELTLEQYHNVAREFGYSETSFVTYATNENVFKVRSFTPAKFEVTGAGHNLLGAVCLALIKKWDIFGNQNDNPWVLIKDTKIPLHIENINGIYYVGMKQKGAEIVGTVPPEIVADAIGLDVDNFDLRNIGIDIVQTEVPHLMVPIKNLKLLKTAISNKAKLKLISEDFGFEGFYLFTTNDVSEKHLAETRFFNPYMGIDEDPATGTAAGPLAGYMEMLGYIKKNQDYLILQGKYVEHPSTIRVNVVDDGIWVSGSSTLVMEGKIYV